MSRAARPSCGRSKHIGKHITLNIRERDSAMSVYPAEGMYMDFIRIKNLFFRYDDPEESENMRRSAYQEAMQTLPH